MAVPFKLNPDLAKCLEKGKSFTMLRHPLVISVPYMPADFEIERINALYRYKREALAKAIADGDAARAVFLHERPFRLQAFISMMEGKNLPAGSPAYWQLLRDVWVDSESPYINLQAWETLFSAKNPDEFMEDKERAALDALFSAQEEITVWRGGDFDGLSYTISREVARWFATRWNGRGNIIKRTVKRGDVLAFTNARDESEIILKKFPGKAG